MSLPDIDFHKIRLHHGTQADAFEELCCQIAGDEPLPGRARFDRKGRGGDAGVECFATLADGSEVGWQVKYYWDIDSLLRELGKSLAKALSKHPNMTRFIACFPIDLSDSRRDEVKTALAKWDTWHTERIGEAAALGRTIEIDRWDGHALKNRLVGGGAVAAGRIAFWFDQELLTDSWFRDKFDRTRDSLGDRYDPDTHIDLPIGRVILATTRDPAMFGRLDAFSAAIEDRLAFAPATGDDGARAAASAASAALAEAAVDPAVPFPVDALIDLLANAADLALDWYRKLRAGAEEEAPDADTRAVSNLLGSLRNIDADLRQPEWRHIDTRQLLVTGEAGTGKSHLLADACDHQLSQKRPALMVLGGKLPDAEPWGEILRDLDLPRHLQAKQFLGALNAAGQAAGVRALIAIDALNEKNGQAIWPERLPGLLSDARQFPWISVVLSCRSTYVGVIVPASLDENKLPRIDHEGFDDIEVRQYLRRCGVSLPDTPHQLEELHNPLFLHLACDLLEIEGETLLPESLGGITDMFELYTNAVSRKVEATLRVNVQRKLAAQAILALAHEMAATGRGEIPFARADELVRAFHDGDTLEQDLLFQLQSEGLLEAEPMYQLSGQPEEVIRFTFERLGDHAIVKALLDQSGGSVATLAAGTLFQAAISNPGSLIAQGLIEALAIQLPERFAMEMPDLDGLPDHLFLDHAFSESLLARRPNSFTERTWELLEEQGDEHLRLGTMIALATEPGFAWNARHLDTSLRLLTMPFRDLQWTIPLALSPERAFHLIEWARDADQPAIAHTRAELAAVQLAWFLTATNRALRDKATKALVAIFADRPALAEQIWHAFHDIDDDYVTERMVAALYGAAMQGRWPVADLARIATKVHAVVFAGGTPPPNVLLRDHARGLVRYAAERGVLPSDFDMASAEPPYASPWPIEHVSDETIDSYTRSYGGGSRYHDEIVGSCIDGDFGRYVLDSAVRDWSPSRRGTSPLPTTEDLRNGWRDRFMATATPAMRDAYRKLTADLAAANPDGQAAFGEVRDRLQAAKAAFRGAVGATIFESWRAEAERWRDEGMYQSFGRPGAAGFNLAWARRWVIKRAHDLGWSEDLHGAFDRSVRSDRNEHSVERIGKKYQWLALYELVARMDDNLAPLPDRDREGPPQLRNIDPSMLRERTEDDGWRRFDGPSYWVAQRPGIAARTPAETLAWLDSSDDILDGPDNIEVTAPDDGSWLVLTGFETWRNGARYAISESWRRIGSLVVRREDRDAILGLLADQQLTENHALPAAGSGGYHEHLGEFPWAWPSEDAGDWQENWRPFGGDWERTKGVTIRATTAEYIAEARGYDASISENINIHLPAKWLMEELGLILSDGRSIEYRNAAGVTLFMDPSVAHQGRSAALVDRQAFLDLLARDGLVAIWAIAGEKNAYGDVHSEAFGGRHTFTRLFYSEGDEIRACDRLDLFESPTPGQRKAFLAGEATA